MKHNKFSHLIERLLVCLPLIYIAVSSAYVVFNKNAKDSYFGDTINNEELIFEDSLQVGNEYYLSLPLDDLNIHNSNGGYTTTFLSIDNVNVINNNTQYDLSTIKYISFYSGTGLLDFTTYFWDTNISATNTPLFQVSSTNNTISLSISFNLLSKSSIVDTFLENNEVFYYIEYNNYSFLNNVMTYSMSEFNKLGFGKLDFTSWFTNIFMNGDTNNVYVQFVNSYLNYFLLVEVVYFIPMIIYWFIHFGESVIEKFTNKEF